MNATSYHKKGSGYQRGRGRGRGLGCYYFLAEVDVVVRAAVPLAQFV